MIKVILFITGLALCLATGYYFVTLNSMTITVRPSNKPETVPVQERSTFPEPVMPKQTPIKPNVADSLRSALDRVVEESIEQELWDEKESKAEKPQQNN